MQIYRKSDKVEVKVYHNEYIIEQFRKIGGGEWQKQDRVWRFPLDKYNELCKLKVSIDEIRRGSATQRSIENHYHRNEPDAHVKLSNFGSSPKYHDNADHKITNSNKSIISNDTLKQDTSVSLSDEKMILVEIYIKGRVESLRKHILQKGYTVSTFKNFTNKFVMFIKYSHDNLNT
ncbi:MAG: hypothetical protein PF505_06040, partial [Vallitaleaceae bacterium]|nr:hypothetical protein [Vallitaleaceae bacterium]